MEKTQGTILIAAYYIAGLIGYFTEQIPAIASLMLLATIFLLWKKFISDKFSIFLYLIFIFAIVNCNLQIKETDKLFPIAPQQSIIQARITSIPTTSHKNKTKFFSEVKSIEYSGIKKENLDAKTLVTLHGEQEDFKTLEIGDIVELTGKLALPRKATNPSQFDYRNYLKNFNTYSAFYANSNSKKLIKKADTKYWNLLQNINRARNKIINEHSQNIKSPNIELLGGIVFGDDAVNPPEHIKKSFINSGLLHILAASGMNVTLIFGIWFFISQKFRFHYKLSITAGIFLILFYTAMTGFGPSILRAALMLIFILLGKLINRDAEPLTLLCFVATLLLIYDPSMINQVGFQLSFIVTFGLLLTCPIIFNRIENKFLNIIASACLVPLIAQIYVAPIQMFYFNTFSTYSLFANIAIIPFLTIVSFLGFISSILALIPGIAPFVCQVTDFVLNPLLGFMINISNFFSSLPNSLITTTHPSLLKIMIYYISIISLTLLLKEGLKSKKLIAITSLACFFFALTFIPIQNSNCELTIFDVGNADAALIKTPNQKYIMVDTGKMPYLKGHSSSKYILLEYLKDKGIKKLDSLILTHFDSDHSGGAIDILENIPVEKLYISTIKSDSKTFTQIMNYLKTNKINYEIPKQNQYISKENGFSLQNISPSNLETNDENEKSIITLLKCGEHKILLPADAGVLALDKINKKQISNIDILKVGHHGSENAINQNLLDSISPKLAIISTGQNSYGHPNNKTINLLKINNIKILRTDYNNAIKISAKKKKLKVSTFNTQRKKFQKITSY